MKQTGIRHFSGKRVWIIGASSGIGEACAKKLIEQGARVALSSRRVERLNTIAETAKANQTLVVPIDVKNNDQLQQGYESIFDTWGAIDLLLFVSGIYTPQRANYFDFSAAEQTIDANLLGPMRAVALVLPEMLKRYERHTAIVSSVAGYSVKPLLSIFAKRSTMICFLRA